MCLEAMESVQFNSKKELLSIWANPTHKPTWRLKMLNTVPTSSEVIITRNLNYFNL